MECLVPSYSGTTLVINVNTVGGSGTFASWNINLLPRQQRPILRERSVE
jgi:hypothetical protein